MVEKVEAYRCVVCDCVYIGSEGRELARACETMEVKDPYAEGDILLEEPITLATKCLAIYVITKKQGLNFNHNMAYDVMKREFTLQTAQGYHPDIKVHRDNFKCVPATNLEGLLGDASIISEEDLKEKLSDYPVEFVTQVYEELAIEAEASN